MRKYITPDCCYEEFACLALIAASTDEYPSDYVDPEFI